MTEIIQGSPEWFALRLGKVTASRVADVVARTKTGYSASRANYKAELITERLTMQPAPSFTSPAMQWGTEQEPSARAAYEFTHGVDVALAGFVGHPTIPMSGASPDGLIGDVGLVEIKCPNTATHIDTLMGEKIADKYWKQIQWQLACCERQWCDFVSFDPRLPASMQLYIERIAREDVAIKAIEKEVIAFLAEIDETIAALTAKYESKAA